MTASVGTPPRSLDAIVLAAGQGTRMRSDLPKVVHPVGGRAMVCAVVDACLSAGCGRVVAVVGYKQELVRAALAPFGPRVQYALQSEQLGTGHAVRSAEACFERERSEPGHDVLVLCGDGPLIRAETLRALVRRHREVGAAATLATAILPDPAGYGRIVRDAQGRFARIVEHRNATPDERAIREVNPSYYCFDAAALFGALARVRRNEASGEFYLTDVPELLVAERRVVEVMAEVPAEDVLSINTPEELSRVDAIYRARQGAGVGRRSAV